jgi:Flp pilus assembly protein TadD
MPFENRVATATVRAMSLERSLLATQGYIELEMPAEALAELDSLGAKDQSREEVLQLRLFVLMRSRLWSRALDVCEQLRRFFPEGSTGYIHGAFCLHELGRTSEARDVLVGGPPALAREATYHYNLACYHAVLGNIEAAESSLRTSFEMDGKFSEIAKYDPDLKSISGLL